jgi:iron complex transport system permease protein
MKRMKHWSFVNVAGTVGVGFLVWIAIATLCLMVGSTGSLGWPSQAQFGFRRESILIASLVGAALASAGVVYQAILRNPLADPYLLGVSSGASLLAYLWQFSATTSLLAILGSSGQLLSQQAFSFIGAILAVASVLVLSSSRGRIEPITILLVGVIVNAVNASIFLLVNAITKDLPAAGGPIMFLVGGIRDVTLQQKLTAALFIAIPWLVLMYFSGELNVAVVSESEAESLGVRIQRLRWIALVLASLVTAAAVAISGPIGFVGLVCPHLARLIVGNDVRRLLPAATVTGASLLAVADAVCRYLAGKGRAETYLPVGVLTGLLGGPFFLLLLWQNRRRLSREGMS